MPTITSTAPVISATGISAPTFQAVLDYLVSQYQGIFGSDLYLGPDSMEGQFLAVIASAINDANSTAIAIYNAYSPATAVGAALSSQVRINGIERDISTVSTVDVLLTGQAGVIIPNGVVGDTNNVRWDLPTVTIPTGGQITVTATCETPGAITALAGTVTSMLSPTLGWQSVTNLSDATPGAPVELDAQLRVRQAASVSLPSLTILEGIAGAIADVSGVARYKLYENDTDSADANSIPAHNIAAVVDGGDAATIAAAIAAKKTPGCGTFGSTTETVSDDLGTRDIKFSRPTAVPIALAIHLTGLTGYTTDIGTQVSQAVADYINSLAIGEKVRYARLYSPANLAGLPEGNLYEITELQVAGNGASLGTADISIAWNEAATASAADVVITAA